MQHITDRHISFTNLVSMCISFAIAMNLSDLSEILSQVYFIIFLTISRQKKRKSGESTPSEDNEESTTQIAKKHREEQQTNNS